MQSPLSFDSTENFRRKLLVKNLEPYNSDGFTPASQPGQSQIDINDIGVIDSQEVETIGSGEGNSLYIKNQYGPPGGYGEPKSIDDVSFINSVTSFSNTLNLNMSNGVPALIGKSGYYDFIASTYNSFNLLTSSNPQGSNGSLSQDSDLARIAAESLKTEFQYRVSEETYQQTIGRVNALDALSDPFDLLGIVTGNKSVIERDWKISVPKSLIGKGLDFISRISGIYSPYSWIPGDYFSDVPKQMYFNQIANKITGLFDKRGVLRLPTEKTGMQIFLDNTGGGQRSRLFKGLSMNRYIPDYNKNFLTDLFTKVPKQNYYVGSSQQEMKDIVAPAESLPLDRDGNKTQTPVYGYDEIAKIYENEEKDNTYKFGLNQSSTYDGGGLQGGFTWVSPKYKDRAGQKVGVGAEFFGTIDTDWNEQGVQNTFTATQSIDGTGDYTFTSGSILDNTQKLINAADEVIGVRKLQHVGNAIDQISKVFHDGTRELTKGSRVIAYKDEGGAIVGKEYCRVFTKDTPYFSMADLQKTEGMTTSNRRFTYSVLDSTYNLNIAPMRGTDTTNLTGNEFSSEGVKKYMFSLENLAWRTSRKKGFTYQDLPHCERGPNGGRIMWFPPYDMKVSEQNSANWNTNEFLGRPEPIYTYNNTTRQGSLSWKIVVDHPSILNTIVDKELANESNNNKINGIVDSFFAGCRKYDIYELALRFPQFTYSDIYDIVVNSSVGQEVKENFDIINADIPGDEDVTVEEYENKVQSTDFDFGYYFHNDVPGPQNSTSTTTTEVYNSTLKGYIALQTEYNNTANADEKSNVDQFFQDNVLTGETSGVLYKTQLFIKKVSEALNAGATVSVLLQGSASSPNSAVYNKALSKRRIDSVKKYFLPLLDENQKSLQKWVDEGKLIIQEDPQGEQTNIDGTNCTQDLVGNDKIYSVNAMKCRRVRVSSVVEVPPPIEEPPVTDEEIIPPTVSNDVEQNTQPIPIIKNQTVEKQREEVAKIIVRKLLTECDYFNLVKESSPMVYDGIKEKIKYFQPAFHSTTPEGLNSRLTFLQQCIRPGDTIPVIGDDGRPTEFNAKNTSYGAPPICVLRIGDFYHTKIAINQISITYEPLVFDLNPEGIGVQPMLADVNMSFFFIGGQGLKEPVNRLQNALSFNYYANTEVYDDRSVVTEQREDLNREIWEEINSSIPFGSDNRPTNEDIPVNGQTIGVNQTEEIVTYPGTDISTNSGQKSYKQIMADAIINVQDYANSITESLNEVATNYSLDGLSYFTSERNYSEGKILGYYTDGFTGTTVTTELFGKPQEDILQNRINDLFDEIIDDVDSETSPLLKKINNKNFQQTDIDLYKFNVKNVINEIKPNFISNYMSVMSKVVNNQLSLIKTIDKVNFVLTNTDGFSTKPRNVQVSISGTSNVDKTSKNANTTYEEMVNDMTTLGTDLSEYYNQIFVDNNRLVEKDWNSSYTFSLEINEGIESARLMNAMYQEILNNKEQLITKLLNGRINGINKWVRYVNNTVDGLNSDYTKASNKTERELNRFSKRSSVKKFNDYSPFAKEKERVFLYINVPKDYINSTKDGYFNELYSGLNQGTKQEFNGKSTFN
tara:strand:- start:32347 stop:37104 length:4758 start_codon:yes stop_codon:yes gene_type:complete